MFDKNLAKKQSNLADIVHRKSNETIEMRIMIENCVTTICTVVLILGLYFMGAGWWSALGGLLIFNVSQINYRF